MSKFRKIVENILYNNLLFESEQKVNWILSQPKLVQAIENRIQNDTKAPKDITPEKLLKDFDDRSVAIQKFLPWVIKMYSNGEFEYTDLNLINTQLENFIKKSHTLEKKDINSYKSLSELDKALKDTKDVKGSRETKRDAKSGAEKIYEDDKWVIIVPHTKEASIQYGKGTKWCTAGVNNNMFNYYNKQGPLYIIINKQNPNEKYQFHFESASYMDAKDKSINLETFLTENHRIKAFFKSIKTFDKSNYENWGWFDDGELSYNDYLKAVERDKKAFEYVPEKFIDYDMCLAVVKANGRLLKKIPERFRDYNMCMTAMKDWTSDYIHTEDLFEFIPKDIIDYNMCLEAVKGNGKLLKDVPEEFKDYNMCLEAIKNHPDAFEYIPDKFKDYDVYLYGVKKSSAIAKRVPNKFKDYNMCLEIVKKAGWELENVPDKLKDYDMCLEAVKDCARALEYVPDKFRDYNMCLEALKKDSGMAWPYIPKELVNYKMCLETVKENPWFIQRMPKQFLDYNICLEAVKHNHRLIDSIPKEFVDYNMCLMYLTSYPIKNTNDYFDETFDKIPDEFKDYNMYLAGVKNNGFLIEFVPDKFKDYNMCLEAVKSKGSALRMIPNKFKNYDLCLAAARNDHFATCFIPDEFIDRVEQELEITNE